MADCWVLLALAISIVHTEQEPDPSPNYRDERQLVLLHTSQLKYGDDLRLRLLLLPRSDIVLQMPYTTSELHMIKAYYLVLKNVLSFEYFDFSGSFVTHLFYFVFPALFQAESAVYLRPAPAPLLRRGIERVKEPDYRSRLTL